MQFIKWPMIFNTIFWNMDFLCVWTAGISIDRSGVVDNIQIQNCQHIQNFHWISLMQLNPMKIMPRKFRKFEKKKSEKLFVEKKNWEKKKHTKIQYQIGNSIFLKFWYQMITVWSANASILTANSRVGSMGKKRTKFRSTHTANVHSMSLEI